MRFETAALVELLTGKGLVAAPIHNVPQVTEYPPIRDRLLTTQTPSGKDVRLPPPSVERDHLVESNRRLPYAPTYGQDTDSVLNESGFSSDEIAALRASGIVA